MLDFSGVIHPETQTGGLNSFELEAKQPGAGAAAAASIGEHNSARARRRQFCVKASVKFSSRRGDFN